MERFLGKFGNVAKQKACQVIHTRRNGRGHLREKKVDLDGALERQECPLRLETGEVEESRTAGTGVWCVVRKFVCVLA